jgi:hypothetical protein
MPAGEADMKAYIEELQRKNADLESMLKNQRSEVTSVGKEGSACCTLF